MMQCRLAQIFTHSSKYSFPFVEKIERFNEEMIPLIPFGDMTFFWAKNKEKTTFYSIPGYYL